MKIAIVTGASSGLGTEFIRRLDRRGELDEIWGVARRADRMEKLAAELKTPMRALTMDLVKDESIEELRALLEREKPDVRVLINSAGFGKLGTYADMTPQETGSMIDLNCKAAVNVTAAVIPHMGRGGRILEICSSAGFQPLPGFNVYAASKAFLLNYSRALRWEVAPRGILVTAVCPTWIKTEFLDVARDTRNGSTVRHFFLAMRPETVARHALLVSRLGFPVATCGIIPLIQRVASKLLPNGIIMACWEGLRRI